jgi:putative oxidoreductase
MQVRTFFEVPVHTRLGDAALLLTRVVAGIAFALHGVGKIQDPFGWMGPDAFAPGLLQALAALSEFGGGLAWVVGLLTPLASLGIACTMAVAFALHAFGRGDPFVATSGGPSSEPAAVYLCLALLLLALGPGRWSLDRRLFGARRAPAERA